MPKIPYIVFELVSIDIEAAKSQSDYKAKQIDTIYMATMPQRQTSNIQGRDAIAQTTDDVFVTQFKAAPENVRLSGTFGYQPRLIGGTFLDGWTRLRQFKERIVLKKLVDYDNTEQTLISELDQNKIILVVNCYDFYHQRFGSITMQDFRFDIDATRNTNLVNYDFNFRITGDLIETAESFGEGDPLLASLNTALGPEAQAFLDENINSALAKAYTVTKWLGMIDVVSAALTAVKEVINIANNYATGAKREYQTRKAQLTDW